jgi:hypothetical protein
MKSEPAPECQDQKNRAILPHPLHAQVLQIGQLPTQTFRSFGSPIEKIPFFGRGSSPVQQRFQVLPSCRKVLFGELPQTRHHTLTWTSIGANRLAQSPILVDLPIESLAVFPKKHARIFQPARKENKGPFSTTRLCDTRGKHSPCIGPALMPFTILKIRLSSF